MKRYIYSRDDSALRNYRKWITRRDNAIRERNNAFISYENSADEWKNHYEEELNKEFPELHIDISIKRNDNKAEINIRSVVGEISVWQNDNENSVMLTIIRRGRDDENYIASDSRDLKQLSSQYNSFARVFLYDWNSVFSNRPRFIEDYEEPDPWHDEDFTRSKEELEGVKYIIDYSIGKDLWVETSSYGCIKFLNHDNGYYQFVYSSNANDVHTIPEDDILKILNSHYIRDIDSLVPSSEVRKRGYDV